MTYPVPALQVVLAAVVIIAAITDIRSRRIPNWLTLSGVVLGIGLNSFLNVPGANWKHSLIGLGLAFLVYFPMYLLRGMGAGDVKLMAAVGSIVGPVNWIGIFVISNILGGIIAVVLLVVRGRLRKTLRNLGFMLNELVHLRPPYLRSEELDVKSPKAVKLPHGAVVALGSVAFLVMAAIWAPR